MNQVVRVIRRANGVPDPGCFECSVEQLPELGDGKILVELIFTSVDPAMRGWLNSEPNYKSVPNGAVMEALGVGRITESRSSRWPAGAVVYGWFGWQKYCASDPDNILWEVDLDLAPAEAWLSALGLNGLTAWAGMVLIGGLRPQDNVLVTTAAGGVGSVVGQLARAAGAHAVGIVGDKSKIEDALGFGYHHVVSYRTATPLDEAIVQVTPNGVDLFFDNTGGQIADAVFPRLNIGARIIQCGTAAVSHWNPHPNGPRREREMLVKRLTWNGLLVFDHAPHFERGRGELAALWQNGGLIAQHDILDGLEQAPAAVEKLFSGSNRGRLLIRP